MEQYQGRWSLIKHRTGLIIASVCLSICGAVGWSLAEGAELAIDPQGNLTWTVPTPRPTVAPQVVDALPSRFREPAPTSASLTQRMLRFFGSEPTPAMPSRFQVGERVAVTDVVTETTTLIRSSATPDQSQTATTRPSATRTPEPTEQAVASDVPSDQTAGAAAVAPTPTQLDLPAPTAVPSRPTAVPTSAPTAAATQGDRSRTPPRATPTAPPTSAPARPTSAPPTAVPPTRTSQPTEAPPTTRPTEAPQPTGIPVPPLPLPATGLPLPPPEPTATNVSPTEAPDAPPVEEPTPAPTDEGQPEIDLPLLPPIPVP